METDIEHAVGLEGYYTKSQGVGGIIKQDAGDFIVEEIDAGGRIIPVEGDFPGDNVPGEYTVFTLVKKNWDTVRAIKEISRRVGVSQRRLGFAGTKDKKAVTTQRVSIYKTSIEKLRDVSIKDVTLKDFGYADDSIGLGDLTGNTFTVTIRMINPEVGDPAGRINGVYGECGGVFPNYYGIQRFGSVRPITHLVGREIIKGDLKSAVMTYLTMVFEGESAEKKNVRGRLAESEDFKAALVEYPKDLGYEKILLNHLVEKPGDYAGAIRRMPKSLQMMFVHAYQSYVFNKALSSCLEKGLNVESLPLVGVDTGVDEESARILEEDGLTTEDFRVREMPELSSRGEYRKCFEMADEFKVVESGMDELNEGFLKATLSFRLTKGCYATVFLREVMKNHVH
ncbi:MAG: tRNA pseudouridine(13) synthase TruD [Candidatus Altiarchaeota archaeon]